MKQILFITLFSFAFSSFMIASTDKFTDTLAVVGSPSLSSDPCTAIDKKLIRLDAFRDMVNNTSAFHLEEKAEALAVPGITVSNNKKKMLRDAEKKYREYTAERQKYGCDGTILLPEPSTVIDKQPVEQEEITTKVNDTSSDTFTDTLAVVGSPSLSSDPCTAIDKKLIRLDAFRDMVNNTSAFHLEEKAEALAVPGITVSNNKKKMLRDAEKKYREYTAERQKYGCDGTILLPEPSTVIDKQPVEQEEITTKVNDTSSDTFTDTLAVVGSPSLSSDPCTAIDKKLIRLDAFRDMVNNTSAFHLEEKAEALAVPGITVSNNKKKMLRDAEKKYREYTAERQKYGCDGTIRASTDKKAVVSQPVVSPKPSAAIDKKPVKQEEVRTNVNKTRTVHVEEKAEVLPEPEITVSKKKEPTPKVEEKKPEAIEVEHPKHATESPAPVPVAQTVEKKEVVSKPVLSTSSSDSCVTIDKKLIKLYEFMIMVNNTSAFHLEEKAEALSIPGISVSNNKKKMLRDAEKKRVEYAKERQKYGCETSE